MTPELEKYFEEIHALCLRYGLDPFPVLFEEVPREAIWDTASYGLPTRMSHWSFGKSFQHQKTYGEMGLSKIYELIINSNPSIAFLDETNSDVTNMLICAHCWAHSDFFKNNIVFAPTNRNMVNQAEANAKAIDEFKDKYGIDAVEDWMDVGFSVDNHIDWHRGENRKKYPPPEHTFKTRHPLPYADLCGEDTKPHVVEEIKNLGFPPHPEKDILWFLINYAEILPWQREVLSIIRSEAFYFYPMGQTQIMNEGWASFWHAEIMLNFDKLSPEQHMLFATDHSKVVRPGGRGRMNPYFVGFRIYTDVKKRWDEYYEAGLKDAAFMKSAEIDHYDEKGNVVMSKIDGYKKIFQIRAEDDDVSFVANYLTRELCEDMKLYTFGLEGAHDDPEQDNIIIKDRALDKVRQALTSRMQTNGVPPIHITKSDETGLYLMHDKTDKRTLDPHYATKTLEYVFAVWKRPVVLLTRNNLGAEIRYQFASEGPSQETKSTDGTSKKKFQI